ncbi:hypothetical protein [Microbacterium sediminis]|uniref:Uncharacterized protein n=1 Tax=Microbacterium sediminis TaxID=904291 RepID=A0A1B9NDX8_9MICO|nr:hypothetical protein [Microbacterium sediminis]OCG74809.1 hypothetical protein A7J15_04640 [Microbacterium sediminis]QBR75110.1 hypothetical protein E3O41_12370 [Microbacterium sediminis]
MSSNSTGRAGALRIVSIVVAVAAAVMTAFQLVMIGSLAGIARDEAAGPLVVATTQVHAVVMLIAAVAVIVVAALGARGTMSGFAVVLTSAVALVMLGHLGVLISGTVQGVSIVPAVWMSALGVDALMVVALICLARAMRAGRIAR